MGGGGGRSISWTAGTNALLLLLQFLPLFSLSMNFFGRTKKVAVILTSLTFFFQVSNYFLIICRRYLYAQYFCQYMYLILKFQGEFSAEFIKHVWIGVPRISDAVKNMCCIRLVFLMLQRKFISLGIFEIFLILINIKWQNTAESLC